LLSYINEKFCKAVESGSCGNSTDELMGPIMKYVFLLEMACVDLHKTTNSSTICGDNCKIEVNSGSKCRHHDKQIITCNHTYKKGKKKGEQCSLATKNGNVYCNKHVKARKGLKT
jgi:hypothetical protein